MPIKINRWACSICGDIYDFQADARSCESKGIVPPFFKVGDLVKYSLHIGYDGFGNCVLQRGEDFITAVVDLPSQYYELTHFYPVRYQIKNKLKIYHREIINLSKSKRRIVHSWEEFCEALVFSDRKLKAVVPKILGMVKKRDRQIA